MAARTSSRSRGYGTARSSGPCLPMHPRGWCNPHLVSMDAAKAIRNAHDWFEVNSGWAPPDDDELAEWLDDGVCRCPDDCLVRPEDWSSHGLASWWLVLRALDDEC